MGKTPHDGVWFPHPFSRAYWRAAAGELANTRVLAFSALMIALRIALKPLAVPVTQDLSISVGFLVNAFAAMIAGPVAAALMAVATDTLGYLVHPTGPYFAPFLLTEAAGSVVFALFLYRARITVRRVTLARFSVNFFVNIVLTTPVMALYYRMMLGRSYTLFNLPRFLKNLVLFPVESVLLVLFLRALMPAAVRMGLRPKEPAGETAADRLRFRKKDAAVLAALFAAGLAAVALYTLGRR